MLKNFLIVLLIGLVVIQFFHPEKNISDYKTFDVSTKYDVPENVNHLLKVACNDCHTNKTEYPWYSKIQPIAWWLDHHVQDGKKHYNLATFTKLPIAVQNHKFEETVEMLEKKEMPLASYTYLGLHKGANLTEQQRLTLINWAKAQMDTLKANYPADSLKMKRRPGGPPRS